MAFSDASTTAVELPKLPVGHCDFIRYMATDKSPIWDQVSPFNEYETKLRKSFGRQSANKPSQHPHTHVVPLFDGAEDSVRICKRVLDDHAVNGQCIIILAPKTRKADGSPAIVGTIQDFRNNFDIFSESSLIDIDWSNIMTAEGSGILSLHKL